MSVEIFNTNANILYHIIKKNKLNFQNFENSEHPTNLDHSFDFSLLETYEVNNECLSSCFYLIKDLFSRVNYIDHATTIRILKENCKKINEFLS